MRLRYSSLNYLIIRRLCRPGAAIVSDLNETTFIRLAARGFQCIIRGLLEYFSEFE